MQNKDTSTKVRLIHAAKKLLAKNSYDYVSTRMIAAEAGVGQSAIFFHFGSKENLCAAVIEDILKYHNLYYGPINQKVEETYASQSMTPELALSFLQEFIQIQLEIAFDPHDKYALCFSMNGHAMPQTITKPLFDDIKNSIELPMAKLLCTYKNSTDLSRAFTICHSANTSLVAFGFTSSFDIVADIKDIGDCKDVSEVKETLYNYVMTSLQAVKF